MKRLLTTLVILTGLIGSGGAVWAQDFNKGLEAAQSGDFATAMKEWKPLAEQGHSDAKLIIAAENGDKNAAFKLGGMYSGTLGGGDFPTDRGMARRYWKIAAEQGHSGAQRIMNISIPWWKPWKLYGWWRFW